MAGKDSADLAELNDEGGLEGARGLGERKKCKYLPKYSKYSTQFTVDQRITGSCVAHQHPTAAADFPLQVCLQRVAPFPSSALRPPSTIHLITTTLPIPAVAKAAPPKKQKKKTKDQWVSFFLP